MNGKGRGGFYLQQRADGGLALASTQPNFFSPAAARACACSSVLMFCQHAAGNRGLELQHAQDGEDFHKEEYGTMVSIHYHLPLETRRPQLSL